jgi:hypothetical protein
MGGEGPGEDRRSTPRGGPMRSARRDSVRGDREPRGGIQGNDMTNVIRFRAKSLWLPGLVTSLVSMGMLQVFDRMGVKPFTLRIGPAAPHYLVLNGFWMLALPALGALGAWWSMRAGGGPRERALAGIFPASPVAFLIVGAFPVAAFVDSHVPLRLLLSGVAVAFLNWTLIPAAALFLGALPFLKHQPHAVVVARSTK